MFRSASSSWSNPSRRPPSPSRERISRECPCSSECNVYIRSIRLDIHTVNAFFQQYRYVICQFIFSPSCLLSSFIISSNAAPNSSGDMKGCSARSFAQISILLSMPIKRISPWILQICKYRFGINMRLLLLRCHYFNVAHELPENKLVFAIPFVKSTT